MRKQILVKICSIVRIDDKNSPKEIHIDTSAEPIFVKISTIVNFDDINTLKKFRSILYF